MIPLTKEIMTIGRKQADILLDDARVSSAHAEIRRNGSKYQFVDLNSTNGSFVNRRRVQTKDLVDQDVIEIGVSTLCFFENHHDFHGRVDEITQGSRIKQKQESSSEDTESTDFTVKTQTVVQKKVILRVLEGEAEKQEYQYRKAHILLGRGNVDLPLLDLDASRSHALIEVMSSEIAFVRDLKSTNGTQLNNEFISHARLKSGDRIQIGKTILEFIIEA